MDYDSIKNGYSKLKILATDARIDSGFGDDIFGNGAIVIKTFNTPIRPNSSGQLIINCDNLIEKIEELPIDIYPYFHVRGRSERRDAKRFPGIRVEARPKKEISNVIFIEKPLRQ
jgi:hypothetical protein